METKYLKINPADNVAVAIVTLPAGEKLTVDGTEITLSEEAVSYTHLTLPTIA